MKGMTEMNCSEKSGVPSAGAAWKRFAKMVFDILLFLFVFLLTYSVLGLLFPVFFAEEGGAGQQWLTVIDELLLLLASLFSAWLVLRMRGLPFSALGLHFKGYAKDWCRGMLFAVALYAIGFGVSLLAGSVEVVSVSFRPDSLLVSLAFFAIVAFFEELTLRGFVLGRMLDSGMNKILALFLSSVLFSLFHFANPDFSVLPFLNILLAGMMLGASYIYTRNLSFPIAVHWFWNWLQGPVLGYEVSGIRFGESLLNLRLSANEWMNGGDFGFEGSLLCTLLLIAGTLIIMKMESGKWRMEN